MTESRSWRTSWSLGVLTPAILVALSQLADGLAFQLAQGHGTELNPGAATVYEAFGPTSVLMVKVVAAIVVGVGSYALLRRHRARAAIGWLTVFGFIGCLTELLAIV